MRAARPADLDFILQLAPRFAQFGVPPWRSAAEVANGTAGQLERAFAEQNGDSEFFIAETEEGDAAGFAWMVLVPDFYTKRRLAKLSEIAVVRNGSGAGAALMAAGEAWARKHACELMILNVLDSNAHARAFYVKHGFAPEHTMMTKDLRAK
ncbi:MAG TPA: GNAT family N-acetyltransferase [Candidatus Baltobacteraceae bacterium]|nr:GNAT family N-acetyltransferase [Candidatus Baltobacteraceae bacterium]